MGTEKCLFRQLHPAGGANLPSFPAANFGGRQRKRIVGPDIEPACVFGKAILADENDDQHGKSQDSDEDRRNQKGRRIE